MNSSFTLILKTGVYFSSYNCLQLNLQTESPYSSLVVLQFPDVRAALAVSLYAQGLTAEAETNWGRVQVPDFDSTCNLVFCNTPRPLKCHSAQNVRDDIERCPESHVIA